MAKKRRFQYKRRSFQDQKKRVDQSGISRDNYLEDGISAFKPAEGDNLIRILPPTWDDPDHYGYDMWMHYQVGADNSSYLCRRAMKYDDGRCPICEEREKAEALGEDEDYVRALKPKKRVGYYLINRDKEGEGLLFWAAPWTVDRDIATQAVDVRSQEVIPLDDPDDGFDVSIKRSGMNERTEYTVAISRRQSEVNITDDIEDILVEKPIPAALIFYDYDHIKKVLEGSKSTELEPKAKEKPPLPTWKALSRMDREELEETIEQFDLELAIDVDDYEDDDDLAKIIAKELGVESPKPKSKKPPPPEPEEEEEDDEEDDQEEESDDDDEEEEDEKPASKSESVKDRLRRLRESKQ